MKCFGKEDVRFLLLKVHLPREIYSHYVYTSRWMAKTRMQLYKKINKVEWDGPIKNNYVIEMMREVGDKVLKCDPAKGVWKC